MNTQIFVLLHLTSVILLSGVTFAAFADPHPDKRRNFLMLSGTLSLLAVMSGFGLAGMMRIGFPGWVMVKVVCWLVLSGLTGMAFRMTGQSRMLAMVAVGVILLAVIMVTYKPF
jgi:hypothetical protein